MSVHITTNHCKATRTGRLNTNMNGRRGVTNYAGHASTRGIGIHVSLDNEPDRPVSVWLHVREDIDALRQLLDVYDKQRRIANARTQPEE